ncbi:hypothetical protein [Streptomyces sp. TR02-1]|uniref:hypothetical protein n=1 Tax=Streptomyces sp. TR02-1 TaxID=3385977 RepID=UPI0039A0AB26
MTGVYHNGPERSVTLKEDGAFTVTGWPEGLDGATGAVEERMGSGKWKLNDVDAQTFDIWLSYSEISDDETVSGGNYGGGFDVSGSRQEPQLYFFVGDPDDCNNLAVFTQRT